MRCMQPALIGRMQNELQEGAVAKIMRSEFLAAMRKELGGQAQRQRDPGDEDSGC